MEQNRFVNDIVAYLHLEYGETPYAHGALKAADLKYVGQYMLDGWPTHFWWYPTNQEPCWATVFLMDDVPCIGMTTTSPDTLDKIC